MYRLGSDMSSKFHFVTLQYVPQTLCGILRVVVKEYALYIMTILLRQQWSCHKVPAMRKSACDVFCNCGGTTSKYRSYPLVYLFIKHGEEY